MYYLGMLGDTSRIKILCMTPTPFAGAPWASMRDVFGHLLSAESKVEYVQVDNRAAFFSDDSFRFAKPDGNERWAQIWASCLV